MELSEIHAALVKCVDTFELLVPSQITAETREKLNRLEIEVGRIADEITLLSIQKRLERSEEIQILREVEKQVALETRLITGRKEFQKGVGYYPDYL